MAHLRTEGDARGRVIAGSCEWYRQNLVTRRPARLLWPAALLPAPGGQPRGRQGVRARVLCSWRRAMQGRGVQGENPIQWIADREVVRTPVAWVPRPHEIPGATVAEKGGEL